MHSPIVYTLVRKRVKNINLRIKPDGSVTVSAAPYVPVSAINQFIESKREYIQRAIARFAGKKRWETTAKQYADGESFYLLGRELHLLVQRADKNRIYTDGTVLRLECTDPGNAALKQKLVTKFFQKKCIEVFSNLIDELYPWFAKYGIPYPVLKVRAMKSRWGSYIPAKRQITLNAALIHFPRRCIEYIIVHEFCHFRYLNHSKDFYSFLTVLMPDWKEQKAELESTVLI